jgi:ribonuclease HI
MARHNQISILQWNIASLKSNISQLEAALANKHYDIITLQETNIKRQDIYKYKIQDFRLYFSYADPDIPTSHGLITAVRTSIPSKFVKSPYDSTHESLIVEIQTPEGPLEIQNLYYSPSLNLRIEPIIRTAIPTIMAGDFNARHHAWEHNCNPNTRGRHLAELIETNPELIILNDGSYTTTNDTSVDITIASTALAPKIIWEPRCDLISDCHFAIDITIQKPQFLDKSSFQTRFKLDKTNWTKFTEILEEKAKNLKINGDCLNEITRKVTEIFQDSAEESIPKTKYSSQPQKCWFWNAECTEAKKEFNRILKQHKSGKYPRDITTKMLKGAKDHLRETYDTAKKNAWEEACQSIELSKNTADAWKKLKFFMGGGIRPRTMAHPDPEGKARDLAKEFADRTKRSNLPPLAQNKLSKLMKGRKTIVQQHIRLTDPEIDAKFTNLELNRVLKINRTSTPGEDGIAYTMVHKSGPKARQILLELINQSWAEGRLPDMWKCADQVAIPKPSNRNAFRPISLLSVLSKIMERMVLARLQQVITWHKNLFGFIEKRGTTDGIVMLAQKASETIHSKLQSCLSVFIDLEKAFELADKYVILSELVSQGVKGKLLAWISDYLTDRKGRVRFQGVTSEYMDFENGTPQGSVLSPTLFNVVINALISISYPKPVSVCSYADDIIMICNSPARHKHLKNALRSFESKCNILGLKISASKTKTMNFTRRKQENPTFFLQGEQLECVKEFKYLGVTFDSKLTFGPHAKCCIKRASPKINLMKVIAAGDWGTSTDTLLRYHKAVIRPILDNGIQALAIAKSTAINKIELMERKSIKLALGIPPKADNVAIYLEAGITPFRYRINQYAANYFCKISQMEAKHPMQEYTARGPSTHPIPATPRWDHCVKEHIRENSIPIPKPQKSMSAKPWLTPTIPPEFNIYDLTKPKSKMSDLELQEAGARYELEVLKPALEDYMGIVNYFTDGSVNPKTSRSAIGIVAINPIAHWLGTVSKDTPITQVTSRILNEPVIWQTQHRITDNTGSMLSELVAIKTALEICSTRFSDDPRDVWIHTDSLSSIKTLQNLPPQDNKNLIREIYKLIEALADDGRSVTFNWLPSHSGIRYNDLADIAANEALRKEQIDIVTEPSLSSIKQYTANITRAKFLQEITSTTSAMANYREINPRYKALNFKNVKRQDSTLILKLRLGLYNKCKRHETAYCGYCHMDNPYSTAHYLLECPVTSPHAKSLLEPLTEKELNLPLNQLANCILRHCQKNTSELIKLLNKLKPISECKGHPTNCR